MSNKKVKNGPKDHKMIESVPYNRLQPRQVELPNYEEVLHPFSVFGYSNFEPSV